MPPRPTLNPPAIPMPDTTSPPTLATITAKKITQNLIASVIEGSKGKRNADRMSNNDNDSTSSTTYWSYGRNFARMGDVFTKAHVIIQHGIQRELADSDDDETETVGQECLTGGWKLLKASIPGYQDDMCNLAENVKLRCSVSSEIDDGRNGCRSDDTALLKSRINGYLLYDSGAPLIPPLKNQTSKINRGWAHPVTASLLCPLEYEATQSTYDDICAGRKLITANQLPQFLYPEGHVHDPDDWLTGLFHGHLLHRAAKQVFQGPSAALEEPGYHRGQSGNAALNGITSMNARSIAYLACQVHFALSSLQQWARVDGSFNYEEFYWNLVALLDDGDSKDIIDYFDYYIFGTATSSAETATANAGPSNFELIAAQRAKKRAHLNSTATTS